MNALIIRINFNIFNNNEEGNHLINFDDIGNNDDHNNSNSNCNSNNNKDSYSSFLNKTYNFFNNSKFLLLFNYFINWLELLFFFFFFFI